MTAVIAYLRVSTDKQAEGNSIADQRTRCDAYARLYDLTIVRYAVDAGQSASNLDRPALRTALDALSRGEASGLLVSKLDRLTRSVRDLDALLNGVFKTHTLYSVGEQLDTSSAAGRLVLNVLASVSQWEREIIAERTSAAMAAKRARGEYLGGRAPYGWNARQDGSLEPCEPELETIRLAREYRAKRCSLASIASELASLGRKARNGKEFTAAQILRMTR